MYALLAILSDLVHLTAMIVWAVGLPLLLWHRWPRLSLAYTWYALLFVLASQLSHLAVGECFLTTLSRLLWEAAGDPTASSFTVRLVEIVAGFRPSERSAVIIWQIAIVATSIGMLWSLHRHRSHVRLQRVIVHSRRS
jgi:hypothetical protein